jgi:hypothetical protein
MFLIIKKQTNAKYVTLYSSVYITRPTTHISWPQPANAWMHFCVCPENVKSVLGYSLIYYDDHVEG